MSDDERRFYAVLELRMTASSLQNASRAAESAAEETDWVGKLDGIDDFDARAIYVEESAMEAGSDD